MSWLRTAMIGAMMASLGVTTANAERISDPKLPDGAPIRVSGHVYVIFGNPTVGIVIGSQAVLVIDTGMGPENGATVTRVVKQLSQAPRWYLTTTHFHPEHTSGEGGFPAGTLLVRPRVQQQELEADGPASLENFRRFPNRAVFLQDVTYRKPDMLFDLEQRIDLGGVHVRLMLVGPAHTRGDEAILVEEDRTLFTGDLAMKDDPPQRFASGASREVWIAALDRLAAL